MLNNASDFMHISHLRYLRKIIVATMQLILERSIRHPNYGWIDLKVDAVTGKDYFDEVGIRDKNHIYSWIQGRGLEAIATHLRWFRSFSGFPSIDEAYLKELGRNIAHNLDSYKELNHNHFSFLIDTSAAREEDGPFTMSDLFCARGLYAFYRHFGTSDQTQGAKEWLKVVIQAIIEGDFSNDQQELQASHYRSASDGRTNFASYMLALGAVTLLMDLDEDEDAPELAQRLIDIVWKRHVNHGHRWKGIREYTIVEYIKEDGSPARDTNNRVALDPGHAVEFVGLMAQLLSTMNRRYEKKELEWTRSLQKLLIPLLQVNLQQGFQKVGGIAKTIDAYTLTALDDSMPWWSLPEAMRAIALVEAICHGSQWSAWGRQWYQRCFDAFDRNYYRRSACPIAIQTIDAQGSPSPVIPATPDLDPGYHTGLSLIACYDVLAKRVPLAIDTAEIEITAKIGSRLAGHVARSKGAEYILDPLYARSCLLETAYVKIALLSFDLLELSADSVARIRLALNSLLQVAEEHIIVSTTHTHTGPPSITLGALTVDTEYMEWMIDTVVKGCSRMGQQMISVSVQTLSFRLPIGMNRRLCEPDTGTLLMRPNPSGSYDDEIIVTIFWDKQKHARALWINTAVHPTALGIATAAISGDYPARAAGHLKKRLGDQAVILSLTGACGDVRPALLSSDGLSFREGTEEDVDTIGRRIADAVMLALAAEDDSREGYSLHYRRTCIDLPLQNVPSSSALSAMQRTLPERMEKACAEAQKLDAFSHSHANPIWDVEVQESWVHTLLSAQSIQSTVPAELSILSIGEFLVLCMIPGELFSSVGKRIKALFPHRSVMVVGYTNGSLGYLPSKEAFQEGGYEVEIAYKYYGLPGPFTQDLEDILITWLQELRAQQPSL